MEDDKGAVIAEILKATVAVMWGLFVFGNEWPKTDSESSVESRIVK